MVYSKIQDGARVCFLGVGCSNLSLMRCLPLSKCKVSIRSEDGFDKSLIPKDVSVDRIFEGERSFLDIDEDILIFSPSIRRHRGEFMSARARGAIFTSDAELFFEITNKPIFAITGSDGKSTTATMVHLLLSAAGYKTDLIGNIGLPMTAASFDNVNFFVAELSSFMLQYTTPHVDRACLTNLTPNHLNWHKDLTEYKKTKINLLNNSKNFVISHSNLDLSGAMGIVSFESFNKIINLYPAELYITAEDGYICKNGKRILEIESIKLKERHNIQNLMMAIAMTDGYAYESEIVEVAKSFSGLSHRSQVVHSSGGVDYIDSSIDSTPARTAATLSSLGRKVVLILGGRGKGLDYSELCGVVKRYAEAVIISGENANEIYSALEEKTSVELICDFDDAIKRGIELAGNVGALLLSPASTSYDRFSNYAERGKKFRKIVLENTKK